MIVSRYMIRKNLSIMEGKDPRGGVILNTSIGWVRSLKKAKL